MPTLVYLRWFDSSIYKGDPCDVDELEGMVENESAGLLVKEDDESITIALDRCLTTEQVRLVLCVPNTNIRSIKSFEVGDATEEGVVGQDAKQEHRRNGSLGASQETGDRCGVPSPERREAKKEEVTDVEVGA